MTAQDNELDDLPTEFSNEHFKTALDNIVHSVLITDHEHKIIYANNSLLKLSSYKFTEIKNKFPTIFHLNLNQKKLEEFENDIDIDSKWESDVWFRCKTGKYIFQSLSILKVMNKENNNYHFVYLYTDMLDTKIRKIKNLPASSYVDELTGLPNRLFLEYLFELSTEVVERTNETFALLYMEIDLFHMINEEHGYNFGNRIIKMFSDRWNEIIPTSSTLIRWNGVEFVIFIDLIKSREEVIEIAENILSTTKEPININGINIEIKVNFGISMYLNDGIELTELLTKANKAMISARKHHVNYQFYDQSQKNLHNQQFIRRLEIEMAIKKNEFEIYYQPIINLNSQEIEGLEALIRWNHPKEGLIPPNKFISLAEQTGLIIEMGEWIFKQVCKDMAKWEKQGSTTNISVNVSMKQFNDKNLVKKIKTILTDSKIDPKLITVELTESVVIQEINDAVLKLNELKNIGVNIAIDDFGTGYSSLGYIVEFPIDRIKIDRSFVNLIEKNKKVEALVSAIITMGEKMGIDIVAEGIETTSQLEFLQELQCKIGQGYLFDKPMTLSEVNNRWLA